ncbi:MAG: methylenetetrahydrofolate reductase [NAD(P)H] [Polyangiaceae bacterium]
MREALASGGPSLSFEFFPPRDAAAQDRLFQSVRELSRFQPSFVSVTYGAGGSARGATADIVERLQKELGLCTVAHLTCVGASRAELFATAHDLVARGVENVLALRGDPPRGELNFRPSADGPRYASQLLRLLARDFDFCLGAACYPEKHPEAESLESDLQHLAEKVDAGAEFLLTQLFFDADDYFAFVARARAHGIFTPIVPGILPATDLDTVLAWSKRCGARVPASLLATLESARDDRAAQHAVGLELTRALCERLLAGGAPGLHLYTRNRSDALPMLEQLDLPRPATRPLNASSLNAEPEGTPRYGLTPSPRPQYVGRTFGA